MVLSLCPSPGVEYYGVSGNPVLGSTIRTVTMTPPPWTAPPMIPQPRRRLVGALATLSALLAIASLILAIVALTRAEPHPTYSAAQGAAAKADLCDRFKSAMNAAHIETNGPDPSFGRIALLNGAVILESAATNPTLDPKYRDTALSVALAYENLIVTSSSGKSGDPQFDSVLNAANKAEGALKDLCDG